jgi:hypothetical protein
MSIENGARLLRRLRDDGTARERVRAIGNETFEEISADLGASCTAAEVVAALAREIEGERFHEPYHQG